MCLKKFQKGILCLTHQRFTYAHHPHQHFTGLMPSLIIHWAKPLPSNWATLLNARIF